MPKFINLSSDYSNFEISQDGNTLILIWKGAVDFSQFQTVGLYDLDIYPITTKNQGYSIKISSNIIQGGLHNPSRIIARRFIKGHTHSIPQCNSIGMLTLLCP